jgi:hypothetical protein
MPAAHSAIASRQKQQAQERDVWEEGQFRDFERVALSHGRRSRAVYRAGSGIDLRQPAESPNERPSS